MIFRKIDRFPKYRQLIFAFALFSILFFWTGYKWNQDKEIEEMREPSWIKVPNFKVHDNPEGDWELYIFSAYFDKDNQNNKIVRIIATAPNANDTKVTCHFYGEGRHLLSTGNGVVRKLSNPAGSPYRGGFVICPLISLEESKVFYVSVSTRGEDENLATVPLLITRTMTESNPKHKFAICPKPVYNYDSVFLFIQWVEFYKLMGVTHFTFYNITMGPKVSCALHTMFEDPDSLTLFNGWRSASVIRNMTLIYKHGQLVQIADCGLRSRGRAKYYISVDLDEYIVPNFTLAKNYGELMTIIGTMGQGKTTPIGQWVFRNAFFIPNSKSAEMNSNFVSTFPELEDLIMYSRATRHKEMQWHGDRSKYIADPWGVLEPEVHYAANFIPPYTRSNVPVDIGYLHHYRESLTDIEKKDEPNGIGQSTLIQDTNGKRIAVELLQHVAKSVAEVEMKCNIKINVVN